MRYITALFSQIIVIRLYLLSKRDSYYKPVFNVVGCINVTFLSKCNMCNENITTILRLTLSF